MSISVSDALDSYPNVQRVLVPTHPGRSFDVYNTYDPPAGKAEFTVLARATNLHFTFDMNTAE